MSDSPNRPEDGAPEATAGPAAPEAGAASTAPAAPPAPADSQTEARLHALEQQVHWLTWRLRTMEQGEGAQPAQAGDSATPGTMSLGVAGAGEAGTAPMGFAPPPAQAAPHAQAAPLAHGQARFAPPGSAPPASTEHLPDGEGTERWVLRAGVLLLALGLAYLFRYSVEQGWLDETARVFTGALLGAGLVGIGLARQTTRPLFAGLLHAAGTIAWIVTLGAASHWYGLISAPVAWFAGIAVLLAATGFSTATRQAAPLLGAGGAAVWLFLHLLDQGRMGGAETFGLLCLVLVPLAASAAAAARSVRALPWAASAFLLALPFVLLFGHLDEGLLPGALRIALWSGVACVLASGIRMAQRDPRAAADLHCLVPLLPFGLFALDAIERGESTHLLGVGMGIAAGLVALALLAHRLGEAVVPPFLQPTPLPASGSLDAPPYGAAHAQGPQVAQAAQQAPPHAARAAHAYAQANAQVAQQAPAPSHALPTLFFLAAAGALLTGAAGSLHAAGWTVGLLSVALCLHHAAARAPRPALLLPAWTATLLPLLWIIFPLLAHLDGKEQPDGLRLLWLLAAGVLFLTAWATRRSSAARAHALLATFGGLLALAGALHALPHGPVLSSVLWAVATLATLTLGLRARRRPLVTTGLGILGMLIVKILFVDLQGLETVWRVLALMGMGGVFLAFGYFVPGLLRDGDRASGTEPTGDDS